jgi:hypothetical protein
MYQNKRGIFFDIFLSPVGDDVSGEFNGVDEAHTALEPSILSGDVDNSSSKQATPVNQELQQEKYVN